MAVPAYDGGRVVVAADAAFSQAGGVVEKLPVPLWNGRDITYPENSPHSIDYFWNVPDGAPKYVANLGQDGYGLLQTSTARQKGRKLFVWGTSRGGRRWQDFLSNEAGGGFYVEVQAGLGRTQYECVPMPPHTAWEWLESYGPLQAAPQAVHGKWPAARREVEAALCGGRRPARMEELLEQTRAAAKTPAMRQLLCGDGWGALENERRRLEGDPPMSPHLDYGALGAPQRYWLDFWHSATFSQGDPPAYMLQPEWTRKLRACAKTTARFSAAAHLHLGAIALAENRLQDAEKELFAAMKPEAGAPALFALSVFYELKGDDAAAAGFALQAARKRPADPCYAREAVKRMLKAEQYAQLLDYLDATPLLKDDGRALLCKGFALLRLGRLDEAGAVLHTDGGLEVPDLREGESTITGLWAELELAKAKRDGETPSPEDLIPPAQFDFKL
jgi:hypothetical protein